MKLSACLAILLLAGCSMLSGGPAPRSYSQQDFRNFLNEVRLEAANKNISEKTLAANLDNAEYLPKVVELDYRQRGNFVPFRQYISSVLTDKKIADANLFYHENLPLLREVSNRYGVDAKAIVALWGMESNFGRYMGNYNVVSSLATLAYDGKRGAFFRGELIDSLKIIDQGNIAGADMKGSWAGAMGQSQFMPSTFLTYAVDEDNDGRRDIWGDKADVFGSIANYLHNLGWKKNDGICQKVTLPADFNLKDADIKNENTVGFWRARGVKIIGDNGGSDSKTASIINLEDNNSDILEGGDYYIVYDNYKKIMKWNRSLYFATSICMMAGDIE